MKHLYRLFAGFCLLLLLFLHWRLHRYTAADYWQPGGGPDVQAQLDWLGDQLRQGAGESTQRWYPEGYFFAHAIYGYALVNQALLNPEDEELRRRNLAEIEWVLGRLDSEPGRRPFPREQAVEYGVFYQGWRNRLLGGLLLLQTETERDPAHVAQFRRQSEALAEAFLASPTRHLEAYPGGSWPVDNVVALSSLRLHDHLFEPRYERVIAAWLVYARANLDPATGLLPHRIDVDNGAHRQGGRASSMVLSLVFLPELDPDFAAELYGRFREQYKQPLLGFVFTREYPHGARGPADVDSGPLIFGLSVVSSGVSMASAHVHGDVEVFERLVQLSEGAGMPITIGGQKRYNLGLLMVGDAFEVWAKTLVPWRLGAQHPEPVAYPGLAPRIYWQLYLLAAVVVLLLLWPLHHDFRRRMG
jgi:hypothetical protein